MTITEKVAYLKGLAEGLALDEAKAETKIIKAMMDVLDDIALSVSDLEDGMDLLSEQLDAVDEDLDELEGYVYEGEYGRRGGRTESCVDLDIQSLCNDPGNGVDASSFLFCRLLERERCGYNRVCGQ
jgi:hypothetical protein